MLRINLIAVCVSHLKFILTEISQHIYLAATINYSNVLGKYTDNVLLAADKWNFTYICKTTCV